MILEIREKKGGEEGFKIPVSVLMALTMSHLCIRILLILKLQFSCKRMQTEELLAFSYYCNGDAVITVMRTIY